MTARAAHRRPRNTGPQQIPAKTPEVPMQPVQPQPPVVIEEAALTLIWQQEATALKAARDEAQKAEPLEGRAAEHRKNARQARAQIEEARVRIEELNATAAELEASANEDERTARLHRDEEDYHKRSALQISHVVNLLGSSNQLTHPAIKQQRAEQAALANGQNTALNAPIGELVSSGLSDQTAPIPTEALQ